MCNDNLIVVDSYIPDQGKNLFCNVPIIGILHLQYGGRPENWDKPAEHTWLLWLGDKNNVILLPLCIVCAECMANRAMHAKMVSYHTTTFGKTLFHIDFLLKIHALPAITMI